MEIIQNLKELDSLSEDFNIGLTIGNFDGVHRGHREFLSQIKEDCQKLGHKFGLITFIPHPLQILRPRNGFLINNYKERRSLLSEVGVDYLYEIDFTRDFSTLSPGDFLDNFVLSSSRVKKLYLGHDFAFGANKSGDFSFVKNYCSERNISFVMQDEFKLENDSVSSSVVREKIENGLVKEASELLGRDFYLSGSVIKGMGRGRQIGFPTANLQYTIDRIIPNRGVYITKTLHKGTSYHSVTNVGKNPTFVNANEIHVETHILDFTRDIYGEELKISFVKKLRDEKKFSGVEELISQIGKDVETAREYFK